MLTTIEIHNFKSCQDVCLNLDNSRLHALVGQNGSGKTSILDAISILESGHSLKEHSLATANIVSGLTRSTIQDMATHKQGDILIAAKIILDNTEWEISCQAQQPFYKWQSKKINSLFINKIVYTANATQLNLDLLPLNLPVILVDNIEQDLHPQGKECARARKDTMALTFCQ